MASRASSPTPGGRKRDRTCFQCGNLGATSRCARCRSVFFCNRQCQIAAWPKHKRTCAKAGSKAKSSGASTATSSRKAPPKSRGALFKPNFLSGATNLFPDVDNDGASTPEMAERQRFLRRIRGQVKDLARGGRLPSGGSGPNVLFRTLASSAAKFREAVYGADAASGVPEGSGLPSSFGVRACFRHGYHGVMCMTPMDTRHGPGASEQRRARRPVVGRLCCCREARGLRHRGRQTAWRRRR